MSSIMVPRIPRGSLPFEVTRTAEIPDRTFTWLDGATGLPIPFVSQPHTFELRIATTPVTVKVTGIFGANEAPNVLITFIEGELDSIPAGHYHAQLWATRTSDAKEREPIDFRFIVKNRIG